MQDQSNIHPKSHTSDRALTRLRKELNRIFDEACPPETLTEKWTRWREDRTKLPAPKSTYHLPVPDWFNGEEWDAKIANLYHQVQPPDSRKPDSPEA